MDHDRNHAGFQAPRVRRRPVEYPLDALNLDEVIAAANAPDLAVAAQLVGSQEVVQPNRPRDAQLILDGFKEVNAESNELTSRR